MFFLGFSGSSLPETVTRHALAQPVLGGVASLSQVKQDLY